MSSSPTIIEHVLIGQRAALNCLASALINESISNAGKPEEKMLTYLARACYAAGEELAAMAQPTPSGRK